MPPPSSYRLEPAAAADLTAWIALKDACLAEFRACGVDQWDDLYPAASHLAADLSGGNAYLLRDAGEAVGAIVLDERLDPLWEGLDWSPASRPGAVHRLMVHPRMRRRGIAQRLMQFAEETAAARGWDALRLDAFSENPAALALYDRLGYRRTGAAAMRKGMFVGFEKRIPLP